QPSLIPGLALEDQRRLVAVRRQMPVEAVVREVGGPAQVPLGERRLPLQHLLERRFPEDLLLPPRPPVPLGVALGLRRQLAVLLDRLDVRSTRELGRRREDATLGEDRGDLRGGWVGHGDAPLLVQGQRLPLGLSVAWYSNQA